MPTFELTDPDDAPVVIEQNLLDAHRQGINDQIRAAAIAALPHDFTLEYMDIVNNKLEIEFTMSTPSEQFRRVRIRLPHMFGHYEFLDSSIEPILQQVKNIDWRN